MTVDLLSTEVTDWRMLCRQYDNFIHVISLQIDET